MKKSTCQTLGENDTRTGIIFVCRAGDHEEGYAACDFTGGYKHRCPHKRMMDCKSREAQLHALQTLQRCINLELKKKGWD